MGVEIVRHMMSSVGPAFGPTATRINLTDEAMRRLVQLTSIYPCTDEELWEVVSEWNAKCDPPWPDDDLIAYLTCAQGGVFASSTPVTALEPLDDTEVDTAELGDVLRANGAEFRINKATGFPELTSCQLNAELTLLHDGKCPFAPMFNIFTRRITDQGHAWTDVRATQARIWLHQAHGLRLSQGDVDAVIGLVATKRGYHPVRDWLTGLEWDMKPRVDTWLTDFLGVAPSEYSSAVGRMWLLSAVARTYKPGCQADHMLLLKGPQGVGKTSALRALAGAAWYSDSPLEIGNKDAAQALPGLWIVEMGELSAMRRTDVEAVKNFLTTRVDNYRPSYGRNTVDVPRGCVFAGTTNDDTPLRDATGARRFWPVCVTRANIIALEAARTQLWAEANVMYWAGQPWWFTPAEEVRLAAPVQEEHTERDPWEDIIDAWLDPFDTEPLTTTRVLIACLKFLDANLRGGESKRVAQVMRRLGYEPTRERVAGRPMWVWKTTTPKCKDGYTSEAKW